MVVVMKNLIFSLILTVLLSPVVTTQAMEEGDKTLSGIVSYYLPDSSFYKAAAGLDLKYAWWREDGKAYAFSVGYTQWGLKGQSEIRSNAGGATGIGLGGDVNMIPIGLSAIWRNQTDYNRNLDVSLELGAKYAIADSGAQATVVTSVPGGGAAVSQSGIDVENSAYLFVAIDLAMLFSDYSDFVLGVGYNYDILSGDVRAAGGKIEENALTGFFFNLGYSHRF